MKIASTVFLLVLVSACNENKSETVHLPSLVYNYVKIDTAALANKHAVYAPVYSHIYTESGTSALLLAATLSVRNISYTDSFYVTDVIYYGSQGELLKHYLKTPVLLKPLHAIEFIVERTESKGGAGANFVVKWGSSATLANEPLIQTIMNEQGMGVSFVTNGIGIK